MRGRLLNERYRLDERIGAGGMGEVWRAQDRELDRTVAVKVFKPSGEAADAAGERPELLARFRQEARAAATLDSPHITAIYDFGTDTERDLPYLVMPVVSGRSLEEVLREAGRLPLERTLRWAEQVCEALAVAHDAGVVHRDIKPGNIMVTDEDSVKVLDFGIAKFLEADDSSHRLTRTGSMPIGSVLYMAPEQFRQDDAVDGRLDLYALGCVLYELLVGRPPYTGPAAGVMYNHLHDTPLRPSLARAELTPAVDRLVLGLMAKEPVDRPAHARDAAERVRTVLADASEEADTEARGESQAKRASGGPEPAPAPEPEPAVASAEAVLPQFSLDELLEQRKPAGELVKPAQAKPAKASLAELAAATYGSRTREPQVVQDHVPEDTTGQRPTGRLAQLRRSRKALAGVAAFAGISVMATVLVGVGVFNKEDTYQIGVTSERVRKALTQALDSSDLNSDRFDLVEVEDTSSWEAVAKRHPDLVALVGAPHTAKPSRIMPVLRSTPVESTWQSRDRSVVHGAGEQADRLLRYLRAEHDLTRLLVFGASHSDREDFGKVLSTGVEQNGGEVLDAVYEDGSRGGAVDRAYVRQLTSGDRDEDVPQVAVLPGSGQGYGARELREDGFEGLIVSPNSPSTSALDRAGFEGRSKLPQDVLRVRAYANPANSPTCDNSESWCSGRGALPNEAGAWEEYDAARVLVTALAEIDLDNVAPVAREALDKALAQVKAEGLLGPVDYGRNAPRDRSARNRPLWLDRTENGRWKEAELLR